MRQSACTYRRRSACVVCALPYHPLASSLSHSLPLACPVLDLSLPSPSLSVPLRLSPLSLLLCFCDLFVSASRVRFSSFFSFSSRLSSSAFCFKQKSSASCRRVLPRTQIRRCIVLHELCFYKRTSERERGGERGEGEGKGKRERDNGASHLHARAHLLSTSFAPKSGAPVNRLR